MSQKNNFFAFYLLADVCGGHGLNKTTHPIHCFLERLKIALLPLGISTSPQKCSFFGKTVVLSDQNLKKVSLHMNILTNSIPPSFRR